MAYMAFVKRDGRYGAVAEVKCEIPVSSFRYQYLAPDYCIKVGGTPVGAPLKSGAVRCKVPTLSTRRQTLSAVACKQAGGKVVGLITQPSPPPKPSPTPPKPSPVPPPPQIIPPLPPPQPPPEQVPPISPVIPSPIESPPIYPPMDTDAVPIETMLVPPVTYPVTPSTVTAPTSAYPSISYPYTTSPVPTATFIPVEELPGELEVMPAEGKKSNIGFYIAIVGVVGVLGAGYYFLYWRRKR